MAKNYSDATELETLNRIVTSYLEFAELQALGRRPMYMADWLGKLDDFLKISDPELLSGQGEISHEAALAKARVEYDRFRQIRNSSARRSKSISRRRHNRPRPWTGNEVAR